MIHRPWPVLDAFIPRLAQSLGPRGVGLHASTLYNKLHPTKKGTFTERDLQLFAIGGFSVERILERGLAELMADHYTDCYRPPEMHSPPTANMPTGLLC